MAKLVLLLALSALLGLTCQAQGPFSLPDLPYGYDALEPYIDTQTMRYHHDVHHNTYVTNLNNFYAQLVEANADSQANLTALLQQYEIAADLEGDNKKLINNAGGHWNHALWWKMLAPAGSANASTESISSELAKALSDNFGSPQNAIANISTAAKEIFGSGWAWLCYAEGEGLKVVTTPNQDSPLSRDAPEPCTPIHGIDVWEHSYYLKYGPKRVDFVDSIWNVTNWAQVSDNYASAVAGDPDSISVLT